MSREKLLGMVEQIKEKITSAEYKEMMDALGTLVPSNEAWRIKFWFVTSSYDFADELTEINNRIVDSEFVVRSEDFEDIESYEAFKVLQQQSKDLAYIDTMTLEQILPQSLTINLGHLTNQILSSSLSSNSARVLIRIQPLSEEAHEITDLDNDEEFDDAE